MQFRIAFLAVAGFVASTVAQDSPSNSDAFPDSMKCLTNNSCPSSSRQQCVEDCLGISFDSYAACDKDCYAENGGSGNGSEGLSQSAGFQCFVDCVVKAQQVKSASATSSASTSTKVSATASSATSSDESSSAADDSDTSGTPPFSALTGMTFGLALTAWSLGTRL